MPERPTSVAAYLGRLPHGLDSYPECVSKASLLRDILASRPLGAGDVPAPLVDLITAPPPVSSWVQTVHLIACTMAVYDRDFGGSDVRAFAEWIFELNRAMFSTTLYRVLFALVSPQRLLFGSGKRWAAFHRGSTLVVFEHAEHSAKSRLEFPPDLFNREMLHAFGAALRAALAVAGAIDPKGEVESADATRAVISLRWTT